MNQTVKHRSHSLVPKALFKISTEPLIVSTCSSFGVIFPRMISAHLERSSGELMGCKARVHLWLATGTMKTCTNLFHGWVVGD